MSDWKPHTGQTIERLYAWIAIEKDGGESVVGSTLDIHGGQVFAPLIGTNKARIESYRDHARAVARLTGRPVRLMAFSMRTVVETEP